LSGTPLYDVESVILAALLVSFGLALVLRRLARRRTDFSIGAPVAVAVGLRVVAVAGVSITGLGQTLRGGDEIFFLRGARKVAASGFDSGLWFPSESHRLHEIVFALQIKLADFPEGALRMTQIGIAMLGIILIVAAIYDLAGQRAARLGAWVLALEPTSIFFNTFLHREPVLVLASGLVVFGGAKIWTKLDLRGVLLLGLGCVIALGTRPYAGWFLMTGGLLLILHASLRQAGTKFRSVPLVYAVAIAVVVATPAVLQLTSQESLEQNLQPSQDANTDPGSAENLGLERVDFSTRSDLVTNLPRRVRDVVLRPYPWQVQNTSQQLGAIGTLVVLGGLYLLFRYIRRNRGRSVALTAPILYPALFLLIAYALSVGNAGTGFRYRTHLVLLGFAVVVVLREHALRRASTAANEGPGRSTEPVEAAVAQARRDPKAHSHRGPRPAGTYDPERGQTSAVRGLVRIDGRGKRA
jgi:hypothetical protein